MNTDLVPVATVYDTTNRFHRMLRFVWRQWSRVRAGLAGQMAADPQIRREATKLLSRYTYKPQHRWTAVEASETVIRDRDATGVIVFEERVTIPAPPTFRNRVRQVRAQRRLHVPAIKHHTGQFPALVSEDEDTWSWLTADEWARSQQRRINNAQMVSVNAEGPLAR